LLRDLDQILDGSTASASLLASIEERRTATKTGDAHLDEWYDALDTGEVPDALWGPAGPPKGWIKGPRGWKAPPGWVKPAQKMVGSGL